MIDIHLDIIDSTNNYAKKHSDTFSPDQITCISAEEQTAGRGRFQRSWLSPRGVNIYATFYFRLPASTPHFTTIAQVLACTLSRLLLEDGLSPKIKWPNDIQLHGKKLSGILCETAHREDAIEFFLGIGINVNLDKREAAQIDQPATSLKIETGKDWDRKELLKRLEKAFLADLKTFKKEGFAPFCAFLNKHLAYKGQTIRCSDGHKEWEGVCDSVAPDGRLKLRLPDGTLHTLAAADLKVY